ncbi:MAG: hypothetical protein LW701_07125 [Fluviicola sp.]|jgi:hypothetical protein|nr:hypothetical protein [Fluviicola sp.]
MITFFKKYFSGILAILIFFSIIINILIDKNKQKLLEKAYTIKGILIEKYPEGKNPTGTFEFHLKNKKIQFDYIGDFSFLKIGDTVLIEYAKDDPTVAKVKDRYYMKKYNYLKTK